ncbi:MAG: TetR/AcrR family transcriptional regulator, partial [Nevskiales bacterium]
MNEAKRGRGRPRRSEGPAIDLDKLLDAAARAFATQGYDATSIRKLAREIGISHSLAHHYYDTKLDLWKACIDRGFGNMQREMLLVYQARSQGGDFEQGIRSMVSAYVELAEKFSDYILILLQEAGRGGDRFDFIIKHYFENFMRLARDYHQQSVDAGAIKDIPWQTLFTMIFLGGPA